MKATLVDVHTVSREVDFPTECPKCKADLTDTLDTVTCWEWQIQKRAGAPNQASGHFEFDERSNCEGGEGFISYVDYWCRCGQQLLEGSYSESEVGDLPPEAEHARYTLELWWEALRENPALRCSYESWVAICLERDKVPMSAPPPTLPEGLSADE